LQRLQTPASYCVALVASRVQEEKGERRGDRGHFIGADREGLDGQLVRGDGAGVTPASSVSREKRGNGGGDDADMRDPHVGEGGERSCIPVRNGALLGLGPNLGLG
jgi:hypothetical protein